MNRKPIGDQTYYNEVIARVVVRMVQIDQRKHPERYYISYRGVDLLGELYRSQAMCGHMYWYFISLAKWLCAGGDMASWRDWIASNTSDSIRAVHKRKFTAKSRR